MRVQEVLSTKIGPADVSELVKKMHVNKTTVYRQLEKLVQSGAVQELEFGDGKKRYEAARDGHHHHLVCNNCHAVTCFELDNDLQDLEKKIRFKKGFKVMNHNLEFFGLCAKCR